MIFIYLFVFFSRQGFSVVLELALELALVAQAGLEHTDLPASTSQCWDCKCSPHTVGRHVCSWIHIKGWWDVAAIFFCSSYCLKTESTTESDTCHWGLSWPGSSWIRDTSRHVLAFCWDLKSDPCARQQVLSPMPSSPTILLALCGLWGSNWVFTLAW